MTIERAVQAWKQGDLRAAEGHCREVLQQQPWNAVALNLLGSIAGRVGKLAASLDLFRKAVAVAPQEDSFRENLARTLLQLDKADEAETALSKVNMQSDQPAGLLVLWGTILGNNGKLEEGIRFVERAISKDPQPGYLFNLAELQRRIGNRSVAITILKNALKTHPNHVDSLNNLAGLQLADGEFIDALQSVEQLLRIAPKSAMAFNNLGTLLVAAGDPQEAAVAFRNSLVLDPNSIRSKFQLANALLTAGELDNAEDLVSQIKASDETSLRCNILHARILERRGNVSAAAGIVEAIDENLRQDPNVASVVALIQEQNGDFESAARTLSSVLESNEASNLEWIHIHFSLGRIYDKLGRYDPAFSHFTLGNKNRKKAFLKNAKHESGAKASNRLISQFVQTNYASKPQSSLDSNRPIFIVGMPRSGTSLTEQILACHPVVFAAGELSTLHDVVKATYNNTQAQSESAFHIIANDPSDGKRCMIPSDWETIESEALTEIGRGYLAYLDSLNAESARVTDKMPFNFFKIPLIHRVFPNAKILHCVRNPMDTCLSCYFQNFASGNEYSYDLQTVGEFYREYESIMEAWRELEIPMFDVQYETLVTDPEKTVREMLEYCDLPWEPECLEFHKSKRPIATASYQQVREPIYTKSVARWKHYDKHLAPLKQALGIAD